MLKLFARRSLAHSRTFATRRGGSAGNPRRRGNNNNKNNNKSLVRGKNYQEPSANAKSSMIYRLVGALGASAAFTGYLFFVYNPGVGDRRFGRQREEDDEYFQGDNYQDEWDDDDRNGIREESGGFENQGNEDATYGSYNEEEGDLDPYARGKKKARRPTKPSSEANNRGTWT